MQRTAKILVVEDNIDMLDGIIDYLEVNRNLEFEVDVARAMNGRQALEVMAKFKPDLIISDIMMPEMDGLEFYRQVRSKGQWTRIPFVFLTARGDDTDIRLGREMGADLYITKPFDGDQLVALMNTQIKRYFHNEKLNKQKISRVKSQMMQVINHEFRTPLTYVTAYLEILQASMNQSETSLLFEYLGGIQNGCVRLGNIVDDLLTVIEIRSGAFGLQISERTELIKRPQDMLIEAAEQCSAIAAKEGIELRLPSFETLPPIAGDPATIQNALARLIDNAIKFTEIAILLKGLPEEKRFVELGVETRENAVIFSIVDHGVGFPENIRYDIFRFFNQYDREYWEQQGCGAGLSIAEAIAIEHGGFITAASERDVETRFELWLPTAEAKESGNLPEPSKRKATVLLVEDDYNLLSGLSDILEIHEGQFEYHALAAEDGLEALTLLENAMPDIIVSDIMMPRMNGYELLETLRQKAEWTQIPVIFLTAMGERVDVYKGQVMGVEAYVTKPYNTEHLLNLVDTHLDRHFTKQNALNEDIEVLRGIFLELLQQDLRPTLAAVNANSQAMVELLQDELPADAADERTLTTSLHNIQSYSGRLQRNVEDLIKLTEMRANKILAENIHYLSPINNIGSYIRGEVDAYNLNEAQLGIKVVVNFAGPLPEVQGDILLLNDVFKRLIEITLGLTIGRNGSAIALEAYQREQFLDIRLNFDGEGLDIKESVAFFEMVMNKDDQGVMQQPMLGPSIVIANEYMQRHKGNISYEEGENSQYSFVVSIPLALTPVSA